MTLFDTILRLAPVALRDPREAAVTLLSLGVPREAIWLGLLTVSAAGALLSGIGELFLPTPLGSIPTFVVVAAFLTLFVTFSAAVWRVGQAMGGKGSLQESLLLTVFLQGIIVVAQFVQLVLLLALPGVAGVLSLAILLYGIWLNIAFIDALHGFASLLRSFAVFFLSSLALAVAITLVGSILFGGAPVTGAV